MCARSSPAGPRCRRGVPTGGQPPLFQARHRTGTRCRFGREGGTDEARKRARFHRSCRRPNRTRCRFHSLEFRECSSQFPGTEQGRFSHRSPPPASGRGGHRAAKFRARILFPRECAGRATRFPEGTAPGEGPARKVPNHPEAPKSSLVCCAGDSPRLRRQPDRAGGKGAVLRRGRGAACLGTSCRRCSGRGWCTRRRSGRGPTPRRRCRGRTCPRRTRTGCSRRGSPSRSRWCPG